MESSYAHIEKNLISQNYKANIAFGGSAAADTVILNNEIRQSRCEGIFVIETGFAWIRKNKIYDNYDGIVMFDATPIIAENSINENQRAGIVACGSSFPKIEKNSIFGNKQSGINFRNTSIADMKKNKVFSNFYQVSMRAAKKNIIKSVIENNEIEGDNEFTNNCTIF